MSIRDWLTRRRVRLDEQDFQDEIRAHLEMATRERMADGADAKAARQASLKEFGNVTLTTEAARRIWLPRPIEWARDFVSDVRYAVRSLARTPGLALFVIVTLALGIGMTATPFSMLDTLVFKPYPVPDPEGVLSIVGSTRDNGFEPLSYQEYRDVRDHAHSFSGVLASTADVIPMGFSLSRADMPRVRAGMLVSGNYFDVLGVTPQLGRALRATDDDAPGREAVAVLSADFWRRDLDADPAVVGKPIRLNGTDFTVVGVAPDSFPGLLIFSRPDVYVPLSMARAFTTDPRRKFFDDRDDRELSIKARLRPGASIAEARGDVAAIAEAFARDFPDTSRDRGLTVRTRIDMRTQTNDLNWKFGVVFTVLALAVLLVACTNVAGLLLSRARTRTREIAVRLALGAGRSRLIRLLLTESLILSVAGGIGGVLVGYAGLDLMGKFSIPTELPVKVPFHMDGRVLIASIAAALLSALACGLAPAVQSTKADLVDGLKAADVEPRGRRRLWGRNMLIVAQVATSLMLLTASFLMFRGFRAETVRSGGTPIDGVLMARFDPRLVQYDADQTADFFRRLVARVRALPGVEAAALTGNPPLSLEAFDRLAFVPDGVELPRDTPRVSATLDVIDPGFFATTRIPIWRGRGIQATDTAASARVAVINEQLAAHYWPGENPVGRFIRLDRRDGEAVEIVGVAATVSYRSPGEKPTDFIYLPMTQRPASRMMLLVRTAGDPLQLAAPLKDVVHALDANLPIQQLRTYGDLYRYHTVEGPGVAVKLVSAMGVVGLVLALAGLYGLVAHNVSRRTREIGIRVAIGAEPFDVVRLMMGKGVTLVAIGTAIGLGMGFGVEKLMNAALFNAGGVDVVAYLAVVPSMFIVAILAAYVPARRASKIQPTRALRYE